MSDTCHCGHDLWEHFLDESDDEPIFGECHDVDCNCEMYHDESDCEVSTHERMEK